MELALISFDGLDPRVIYNNLDELPNFKILTEESMHGSWKTPGHTIPSFTAALTGQQYPVTDFRWDKDEGGYARHRQTGFDYLWDVCESSMSLLNMPVVYPPEEIDDAMVSGFLAPDEMSETNIARPTEVQDKLNEMDYTVDVEAHSMYEELGAEGMKERLYEIMDKRTEAAEYLIDEYDSDLFFGVWSSPDRWFHIAFMEGHDHYPLYEKADEVLGEMMEKVPDDVPVVAFSDHGFRHWMKDDGVHKGHMYEGWYAMSADNLPPYRDDSNSIFDLFPTVVNYLEGEAPDNARGRVLFHPAEQDQSVKDRLSDLGYME